MLSLWDCSEHAQSLESHIVRSVFYDEQSLLSLFNCTDHALSIELQREGSIFLIAQSMLIPDIRWIDNGPISSSLNVSCLIDRAK